MDWNHLESKGWEKVEEIVNGKKNTFYRAPPINGIRKKIARSRDLKGADSQYASILFPASNLAKKHQADKRNNNEGSEDQISRPSCAHLTSNPGMYIFFCWLYIKLQMCHTKEIFIIKISQ